MTEATVMSCLCGHADTAHGGNQPPYPCKTCACDRYRWDLFSPDAHDAWERAPQKASA